MCLLLLGSQSHSNRQRVYQVDIPVVLSYFTGFLLSKWRLFTQCEGSRQPMGLELGGVDVSGGDTKSPDTFFLPSVTGPERRVPGLDYDLSL